MHSRQVAIETKARQWVAICRRGFSNEHAHRDWLRARILEMQCWPEGLRFSVMVAWINSGPKKELSR